MIGWSANGRVTSGLGGAACAADGQEGGGGVAGVYPQNLLSHARVIPLANLLRFFRGMAHSP